MCYGSGCAFECSHNGECNVRNFNKFKELIGEPACLVGGFVDCKETEEYLIENKEKYKSLREKARELRLV